MTACACLLLALASLAARGAEIGARSSEAVIELVDAGRFKAAEARIAESLGEPGLSAEERQALAFERERMRRILLDFTLDRAQVEERVRKQIPDLREAEFAALGRGGAVRTPGDRRPQAVLQPLAFQFVPPERAGARAA